ncbi:MAG: hypothetical protein M1820_004084 [Bogoriella megaspora]|nr:MAG: hypothetical protein M1820_004084 [Bogoriella megaspora]
MLSSAFLYPLSHYKEVIKWVTEISPEYGNNTEIVAVSVHPPDLDRRCIMALFLTFQNSEEEARVALRHANQTRPDGCMTQMVNKRTSLAQEYCDQATASPQSHRYTAENAYIANDADVPAVLEKAFTEPINQKSFALYFAMAPCSRRLLPDMALSMQSDHYFAFYSIWEDEENDLKHQKWVQDIMREVEPHSVGAYLGDSDFQVRQTRFWMDEKAERLMRIRRQWDPDGIICGYLDAGDKSGVAGLTNEQWSSDCNLESAV